MKKKKQSYESFFIFRTSRMSSRVFSPDKLDIVSVSNANGAQRQDLHRLHHSLPSRNTTRHSEQRPGQVLVGVQRQTGPQNNLCWLLCTSMQNYKVATVTIPPVYVYVGDVGKHTTQER